MSARRSLGILSPILLPLSAQGLAALRDGVNTLIDAINSSLFGNLVYANDVLTVSFPAANTDLVLPHFLGRVPQGIVVLSVNVDGAVVRPVTAKWTVNTVTLRSSAIATEVRLVVV
jgi:hypothetical protein